MWDESARADNIYYNYSQIKHVFFLEYSMSRQDFSLIVLVQNIRISKWLISSECCLKDIRHSANLNSSGYSVSRNQFIEWRNKTLHYSISRFVFVKSICKQVVLFACVFMLHKFRFSQNIIKIVVQLSIMTSI